MLDTVSLATLDSYQNLSVRTLNDQGTDRNRLHCVMGMAGEAGEIEELRSGEYAFSAGIEGEVGDCFWYASTFALQFGWKLSSLVDEIPRSRLGATMPVYFGSRGLVIYAARLMEIWKKLEFYPRPFDEAEVRGLLVNYLGCLLDMCEYLEESPITIAYSNLNKLQHDKLGRYKSGLFTEGESAARNYLNESKAAGTTIV